MYERRWSCVGRGKPRRRGPRRHPKRSRYARKPDPRTPEVTTFKQRVLLIALGLGIIVVVLVLLEGALRISGYGEEATRPTAIHDIGQIGPLFRLTEDASGGAVYTTCSDRLTFFNHQEFSAKKRPGTFRIFCFGGSSTYGRPYRCDTAFPRWIELILNSSGCDLDFEVINMGGISYASYRVVNLVREVLESDYHPDLLIVYSGHNEFLEKWTRDRLDSRGRPYSIRMFLDRFRLVSLLRTAVFSPRTQPADTPPSMDAEVDAILDRAAGLDYYVRNDEQRANILGQYERSLERVVEMAGSHGIPVLLVTMVSNLRDFSPFKSSHSDGLTAAEEIQWDSLYALGCSRMESGNTDEALDLLTRAAAIDHRYADLQFRLARCLEAVGDMTAAERCYSLARDEDICPLRAPEQINEAIRQVAAKYDVSLVDFRSHLRDLAHQRTGCPILGNEFFLDHVHLTIEGYQLMALAIVKQLEQEELVDIPQEIDPGMLRPLFAEAEACLDTEYMAEMHLNLGKVLAWAGKKKEAAPHLALAAQMGGQDAEAHYRIGKSHREAGQVQRAVTEFQKALGIRPDYAAAHNDLGLCYLTLERVKDAEECFRKAMELRPDQAMPHIGLGRCYAARGLLDQAVAEYEKAVAILPDYAEGLNNLGLVYEQAGRFDDAERTFKQLLTLYPDFAEARNNLGLLYLDTGRRDMAEAEFRTAMRSKPDLHQTYGNLGLVFLSKGDRAGAAAMFRKVIELNPGDPDATRLLASLERD
jgi:tetratricopeptide (TPR) repeat protein